MSLRVERWGAGSPRRPLRASFVCLARPRALSRQVLRGLCATGGCGPGTLPALATALSQDTEACAIECFQKDGCGYFTFERSASTCSLYNKAGGCEAKKLPGAGVSSFAFGSAATATVIKMTDRARARLERLAKQVTTEMGTA